MAKNSRVHAADQSKRLSRRRFLGSAAVAAAGISVPYYIPASVLGADGSPGANDRVIIGMIGMGARGKDLTSNVPDGARVAVMCDSYLERVHETLRGEGRSVSALAAFRQRDAERVKVYQDYRKMIGEEKLDGVMIATSDHHHVLPAILACQADIDIYVEKCLTLTIGEGRALVRAVEHYKRVAQVGSQQRSMEMNRFACQFVRDGGLGKIKYARAHNNPGPLVYDELPEEPVPEGLDWDLYCGPTPLRPHNWRLWVKDDYYHEGQLWRGWDMWRAYAGHLMTNWGGHGVDQMQWALGTCDTGPVEIWPETEGYTGEMRACPVSGRYANGVELQFRDSVGGINGEVEGEDGIINIARNSFRTQPANLVKDPPDRSVTAEWRGTGNVAKPHIQNWLDCIKSREETNAPIEAGHRAASICHLANICRELRRKLKWDPEKEVFPEDEEANALVDRPRRKGFELPEIG